MNRSTARGAPRLRLLAAAAVAIALFAPRALAGLQDTVDYDALYRIKDEGFERSQVMEIASWLTDVHGPRLTGSPTYAAAADWTRKTLSSWGLSNVRLEPFEFGRGWSNERFSMHVVEPATWPVIGYPKAWTPGTSGPVRAPVAVAPVESERDFDKLKGTLKGKIVLASPMREVKPAFEPLATRFSDEGLARLEAQDPAAASARQRPRYPSVAFLNRRAQFFQAEGVVAVIEASRAGDGGTVFVQSGGSRNAADPPVPPQIVVAVEHYGRIWRTIERKLPVTIEIDVRNSFHDTEHTAHNILAEIPGTRSPDEVVMLGAHFDSWHAGTGATDDAAGSAIAMEAMRILKASAMRLDRTVRLALWAGEEQGLLGSKAYVKEHFADPETMTLKPGHAKLSAYFNVDNGTGAIRGLYLQRNEAIAPIFRVWMEPFRSLGMTALAMRSTGGTDHVSFDAVGIPGFQFIQDEVEYDTRTHHSNMDVYERLQAGDMMKNAVILSWFVYQAANRDGLLPRKPLPEPTRGTERRPPTAPERR